MPCLRSYTSSGDPPGGSATAPASAFPSTTWERGATAWNVTFRRSSGPDQSDEPHSPIFANTDPSRERHQFYIYDDTGIHFDPSDSPVDTSHIEDGWSQIGDYTYVEKAFKYTVQMRVNYPGQNINSATWYESAPLYVSQTICYRIKAKTHRIEQDMDPLGNKVFVGKIDPIIDQSKVRSVVGDNLPIHIDPISNEYLQ